MTLANADERRGGRNLVIMGVAAIMIAIVTTVMSVAIYHNSGDIYLDRSRPGLLPDKEEIEEDEENPEEGFEFEKTGLVTKEVVTDYLEHFETEVQALDAYENPFGPEVLDDERLGM